MRGDPSRHPDATSSLEEVVQLAMDIAVQVGRKFKRENPIALANDLVEVTMTTIEKNPDIIRDLSKWMTSVAQNIARANYRKMKREFPVEPQKLVEFSGTCTPSAESVVLANELRELLPGALETLTPKEKHVFSSLLEGISAKELADSMAIKIATVRVHDSKAKRKIRSYIGEVALKLLQDRLLPSPKLGDFCFVGHGSRAATGCFDFFSKNGIKP